MVREGEGGGSEGCLTSPLIINHLHHFALFCHPKLALLPRRATACAAVPTLRFLLCKSYEKTNERLLNIKFALNMKISIYST